MSILLWTVCLLLAAISSNAQEATEWCDTSTPVAICFQKYTDATSNVSWAYTFPPAPSDEFVGVYTAPLAIGWVGASLGGPMRSNLLLASWTSGSNFTVSPRFTANYGPPPVYTGPTLTILPNSAVNETHQTIAFRCSNCTSWGTASIPANGTSSFGFVYHATSKPLDPTNADSTIQKHTSSGQHTINITAARQTLYTDYVQYLLTPPAPAPAPPS